MSGFIAISRKMIDHPLFKGHPDRVYAWTWLIAKAAWKPVPYDIAGKMIMLERGQVCASFRQLASEWKMSKTAVGRFMDRLKTETMVDCEAGHGKMVISICNYDKYQDIKSTNRDSSGTLSGTAAGQQRDTKEPLNHFPSSNEEGAAPDALFWKNAKSYLAPYVRGDPGRLIGKWVKESGQAETAKAITASQLARAVEPVPYIQQVLKKSKQSYDCEFTSPC